MYRLLSIELQKIWLNRSSKILTISYFIILTFIAFIASIEFNFGNETFRIADQGIFNFPYIWHFNTFLASWLKIFLAIVIVSMMSNEYSYGTLKQNLIDGLSKKEFVLSKVYTVIFFALISTFFIFVVSLLLGLSFSAYLEPSIIFSDLEYILAYFVKLIGFFTFCLFLGILIRRSAFALGFLFIWFILEFVFYSVLKKYFFTDRAAEIIFNLFPLQSMYNLIAEPFTRLSIVKNFQEIAGGVGAVKNYDVSFVSIVVVLVWSVIFVLMSYKLLQKRDL
jgi:ABC-type transport system involved in multi-copper enzyme maturation permease subunit